MKWLKIVKKITSKAQKIGFISFISYKISQKSDKKLTLLT